MRDSVLKMTRAQIMSVQQLTGYAAREFELKSRKDGVLKAIETACYSVPEQLFFLAWHLRARIWQL